MLSSNAFLAVLACITTSVSSQGWSNNFYTTENCTVGPTYSRIGYGDDKDGECVTIGNNQAGDCYLVHQDPSGTNAFDCTGPDGPGLSGAPLLSVSGFDASCDFFTDYECTQGQYHYNLSATYNPYFGFYFPQCHTTVSKDGQAVKSFKCAYYNSTA